MHGVLVMECHAGLGFGGRGYLDAAVGTRGDWFGVGSEGVKIGDVAGETHVFLLFGMAVVVVSIVVVMVYGPVCGGKFQGWRFLSLGS